MDIITLIRSKTFVVLLGTSFPRLFAYANIYEKERKSEFVTQRNTVAKKLKTDITMRRSEVKMRRSKVAK